MWRNNGSNNSNRHWNGRRRARSSGTQEDSGNPVKEHWARVGGNLNGFRAKGKFCDIQIKVGQELFAAHKAVLAGCSHYFEAMFTIPLAEGSQSTVELKEISPQTFHLLMEFMYSGEVKIREDNVQQLLAAANMLELQDMVTNCCNFLRKKLDPSNCIGIFRFSELHGCTRLKFILIIMPTSRCEATAAVV